MRSGRLLAEEAPQVLLSIYGCQSLEEVFLKLSRKQQGSESNNLQEVKTNNTALVSTIALVTKICVFALLKWLIRVLKDGFSFVYNFFP